DVEVVGPLGPVLAGPLAYAAGDTDRIGVAQGLHPVGLPGADPDVAVARDIARLGRQPGRDVIARSDAMQHRGQSIRFREGAGMIAGATGGDAEAVAADGGLVRPAVAIVIAVHDDGRT